MALNPITSGTQPRRQSDAKSERLRTSVTTGIMNTAATMAIAAVAVIGRTSPSASSMKR